MIVYSNALYLVKHINLYEQFLPHPQSKDRCARNLQKQVIFDIHEHQRAHFEDIVEEVEEEDDEESFDHLDIKNQQILARRASLHRTRALRNLYAKMQSSRIRRMIMCWLRLAKSKN